jgi:hypothetical protein
MSKEAELYFKEWVSTRPNLKTEFHDASIEAMAFAESYHRSQLEKKTPSHQDINKQFPENGLKDGFGLQNRYRREGAKWLKSKLLEQ